MNSKEAQQVTDEVLSELQSSTKKALDSCSKSVFQIKIDLTCIEGMLEIEYPKKNGSGLTFELQEIEARIAGIREVVVIIGLTHSITKLPEID